MIRKLRERWRLFLCAALGHDFGQWERFGLRMFFTRWCSRCGRKQTGVKASDGRILPVTQGVSDA